MIQLCSFVSPKSDTVIRVLLTSLFLSALSVGLSAREAVAADESFIEIVKVDAIDPKPDAEKGWTLIFNGRKAGPARLPQGTVLDGKIRWRYKTVEQFEIELDGRSSFKHTHESRIRDFSKDLYFSVDLVYSKQTDSVQKFLDQHPDLFPKDKGINYGYDKPLPTRGTEEQVAAQERAVKQFFVEHVGTLRRVDKELLNQINLVKDGEAFRSKGEFSFELWSKWLEKSVRDPIREVQKAIREASTQIRFMGRKRDLEVYLSELSRAVARRTIEFEAQMLSELGVEVDPADRAAKDLEAISRRFRNGDLKSLIEKLEASLGVDL